jgi:hypothetical protein
MTTDLAPIESPSAALARLEQARTLLAPVRRVEEAAQLRHQAHAVEVYLRQQEHAREAELDAAEIRLRAERKAGQLLAETVNRPSDRQAKYLDKRANPDGKTCDSVWGVSPPIPRLTGTCAERLPDFPTQLPLDLLRPMVGCASDPGDLVIDPFAGSATTGVAALVAGRRFLGIERQAKFADLAAARQRAAPSSIAAG